MMIVWTMKPWITMVPNVAASPTSKELSIAIRFEGIISPGARADLRNKLTYSEVQASLRVSESRDLIIFRKYGLSAAIRL
jgi:hypothetical protein